MRLALAASLILACSPLVTPSTPPTIATPSVPAIATPSPTVRPTPRTPQPVAAGALPTLVLSYERYSDIPIPRGPELLVTSDGQVVTAPAFADALTTRRLTPAGIVALRTAVLDTGLFTESRSLGRQLVPGASAELNRGYEALAITIRVGDREVRVSTFAKDPTDDRYRWDPGRDELLALATRLSDLSWLPASAWVDPIARPYAAAFHRLYIETLRGVSGPNAVTSVDFVWPFTPAPDRFGETVTLDPSSGPSLAARCGILSADDARILGEAIAGTGSYRPDLRATGRTYLWPAGNGEILLQLEPLLPHVQPTCAGVRRLVY